MTGDVAVEPGGVVKSVPALAGYVVLYVVAAALCAVAVTLMLSGDSIAGGGPAFVVAEFFGIWLLSLFFGAPVAMLLTPLLHVALGRVRSQSLHVLVFGLAFTAGVELELLVMSGRPGDWLGLILMAGTAGLSAAVGRLVVSGERWRVHPTADWMRELHR